MPIGSLPFVQKHMQQTLDKHQHTLKQAAAMTNIQVAYLILRYCLVVRLHYWLRIIPQPGTHAAAERNDRMLLQCLASLLDRTCEDLPAWVAPLAALPTKLGGVAFTSSRAIRTCAFLSGSLTALLSLKRHYAHHLPISSTNAVF